MQESHLRAPIMLLSQNVHPKCPARRKINLRRSFGHLFIRKKRPALNLEKRFHFLRLRQYPFERERIDAPPYAVSVFCTITHAGTTSNAYSNWPFKNPGPCGLVKINPYRNPRFHTPVSDVLPLIPCPPPVQICSSRPEFSGDPCARSTPALVINTSMPDKPANKNFRFTWRLPTARSQHNIRKPIALTINESSRRIATDSSISDEHIYSILAIAEGSPGHSYSFMRWTAACSRSIRASRPASSG